MPAITLSKVGSHLSDRETIAASYDAPAPACMTVGSIADMADYLVTQDFATLSLK